MKLTLSPVNSASISIYRMKSPRVPSLIKKVQEVQLRTYRWAAKARIRCSGWRLIFRKTSMRWENLFSQPSQLLVLQVQESRHTRADQSIFSKHRKSVLQRKKYHQKSNSTKSNKTRCQSNKENFSRLNMKAVITIIIGAALFWLTLKTNKKWFS